MLEEVDYCHWQYGLSQKLTNKDKLVIEYVCPTFNEVFSPSVNSNYSENRLIDIAQLEKDIIVGLKSLLEYFLHENVRILCCLDSMQYIDNYSLKVIKMLMSQHLNLGIIFIFFGVSQKDIDGYIGKEYLMSPYFHDELEMNASFNCLAYAMLFKIDYMQYEGVPFDSIIQFSSQYKAFAMDFQIEPLLQQIEIIKTYKKILSGESLKNKEINRYLRNPSIGFELNYYLKKAEIYFFLSMHQEANAMIHAGNAYYKDSVMSSTIVEFKFFEGMIISYLFEHANQKKKSEILYRLACIIEILESTNLSSIYNIVGIKEILLARWFYLRQCYRVSLEHSKKAIGFLSGKFNFQYKGICYECMGLTLKELDNPILSHKANEDAIAEYSKWGCEVKVNELKAYGEHKFLNSSCINERPQNSFDLFVHEILACLSKKNGLDEWINCISNYFKPNRLAVFVRGNSNWDCYYKEGNRVPLELIRYVSRIKKEKAIVANEVRLFNLSQRLKELNINQSYCIPVVIKNRVFMIIYLSYAKNTIDCMSSRLNEWQLLIKCVGLSRMFHLIEKREKSQSKWKQLDSLTEAEKRVLEKLKLGMTNKEISNDLFISINTVKTHIKAIYQKLEVNRRVNLMKFLEDIELME